MLLLENVAPAITLCVYPADVFSRGTCYFFYTGLAIMAIPLGTAERARIHVQRRRLTARLSSVQTAKIVGLEGAI